MVRWRLARGGVSGGMVGMVLLGDDVSLLEMHKAEGDISNEDLLRVGVALLASTGGAACIEGFTS